MVDNRGWIDVTLPIRPGMPVWPDDPPVEVQQIAGMASGAECNITRLSMCVHTGTHLDAPLHYIADGVAVDQAPLDALVGRARVLQIDDDVCITESHLAGAGISRGERLLFRTKNCLRPPDAPFDEGFIYLERAAAQYLADAGVIFVGIDGMSVGGFNNDMVETHLALLAAQIWVAENVDLRQVDEGTYDMVCLPLKIMGADGAPARIILKKRD